MANRRARSLTFLAIGLVSGGLGFAASLTGSCPALSIALGATAALTAAVASIGQYKLSGAYVHPFEEADWEPRDELLHLCVPASTHGKGKAPKTTVMQREAGRLEEIFCDVHENGEGDIEVGSGSRFSGELRIT